MAAYDYINQSMVATALIQNRDDDSFYNPETLGHNGFAADGTHYTEGVQDPGPVYALWFKEVSGPYRGAPAFPAAGLILLSRVALTILDESNETLPLWMQFILADAYAMANNFNGALDGFLPTGVVYADGIISVTYQPDPGAVTITSNMVVTVDFVQDQVYLDVAV